MNINFMRFRKIAITISLILFVGSIGSIFMKGLSLGLDFSGGTLVEIQYEDSVDLQEIRAVLSENGRNSLSLIAKDLRNAGYKNQNYQGTWDRDKKIQVKMTKKRMKI